MQFFNIVRAIFKLTSEIGCLAIKMLQKICVFCTLPNCAQKDTESFRKKLKKTGEKRQRLVFFIEKALNR